MPLIPPTFLKSIVYLDGRVDGSMGTGFFVGVPSTIDDSMHIYVVTAKHCMPKNGQGIRVKANSVGLPLPRCNIIINYESWIQSDTHDVMVAPFRTDPRIVRHMVGGLIPLEQFITKEVVEEYCIGPGDEVFMIGRFSSRQGKEKLIPTARFGNISAMPDEDEPLEVVGQNHQSAFLVEMRSIPGFSGSPVFCHTAPGFKRWGETELPEDKCTVAGGPWLLGVDFCHLTENIKASSTSNTDSIFNLTINTGMAGVVPAWHIADILNSSDLAELRKADEQN